MTLEVDRLRREVAVRNWSVRELASAAGICTSTARRALHGRSVALLTALAISRAVASTRHLARKLSEV